MKIDEMRQMTLDELQVKLKELSESQFNFRFRINTEPLQDPLQIRKVRRDIARVKTLIREREREEAASNAAR